MRRDRAQEALERAARRFRWDAMLRKRRLRARATSEGVWDRLAIALALAGPRGVYRARRAWKVGRKIAAFSRPGGGEIEVRIVRARPEGALRTTAEEVLRAITRPRGGEGRCYLCVVG